MGRNSRVALRTASSRSALFARPSHTVKGCATSARTASAAACRYAPGGRHRNPSQQPRLPVAGFEIIATTAFPTTSTFDDRNRRRSSRDVRNRVWPPKDLAGKPLTPEDVFGFGVDGDGKVELPPCSITLLRVDGLPAPELAGLQRLADGRCAIPLDVYSAGSSTTSLGIVKESHKFPDKKARQLELRIRAIGRHAEFMETAKRPASHGRWLRSGKLLPPGDICVESEHPIKVWMPADIRPAKPVARSPIPAFAWNRSLDCGNPGSSTRSVTRRMVVRIPLERGWWSSGEDEQLGIVLWPPNIFQHDGDNLTNDKVTTVPLSKDERPRDMDLSDFLDDDLGPGGRYITRWGADPIRSGVDDAGKPNTGGSFIPAHAFSDYSRPHECEFIATPVENVEMPIEDGPFESAVLLATAAAAAAAARTGGSVKADGAAAISGAVNPPGSTAATQASNAKNTSGTGADAETTRAESTLMVSLLAYQPRFDVETESWYVDVGVECDREAEPFVRFGMVRYQPHAPANKQVSYPIVQWAQLLPRRHVDVESTISQTQIKVDIKVIGLAVDSPPRAKQERAAEEDQWKLLLAQIKTDAENQKSKDHHEDR